MKKSIQFILIFVFAFILGIFTHTIFFKTNDNQMIDVYGTYVSDMSTLSINHDLTYHYSYPFSYGQVSKIDEDIYFLSGGEFDGYIALFYDDSVKLITPNNDGIIKVYTKNSGAESDLSH